MIEMPRMREVSNPERGVWEGKKRNQIFDKGCGKYDKVIGRGLQSDTQKLQITTHMQIQHKNHAFCHHLQRTWKESKVVESLDQILKKRKPKRKEVEG